MRLFRFTVAMFISPVMLLALLSASLAFAAHVTITVGTAPEHVAVNRATNLIYVSNLNSNNVSVIDGATNAVVATIPVGVGPESIDVNSTTNTVYVANSVGASVSVIDGSTNAVVATIMGMSFPYGVAVNSTTNQVFVSNLNGNDVAVIDGATNTIATTVAVGSRPAGVSVSPTADLVYVCNTGSGTISVISGASDTVTNTFTLPQAAYPGTVAVDRITNRLFITDGVNAVVYVLDASSGALLKTITGGKVPFKEPACATVFQPGKTVLISDLLLNAVFEVSESSYATSGELRGGIGPMGVAASGTTGSIYVTESTSGTLIVYGQ
jgi:YVTN family beta-propeller protein